MADSKISALTSGNPAQSGDEIPIARGGANYKITAGSIASLGGDVDGPASSVDNQIALFDSTTGKLIKAATTTGVLKASSGVIAAATSGTDYAPATSGTSILKGSGTGGFSNAAAGSDYLAPPSGTAILKANSGGALANATAGTDYAPATTGTNVQLLANSGSGGFANVNVGSGLTLSAGTLSASGGGGSPGGSNTQVQYNNSGAFGGISGFTTDGTRVTASTTIGVGGATPSTSGAGITFPATQSASTDANTLDDYEEGTWSPTCSNGSTFTGNYIKIGKMVHLFYSTSSSGTITANSTALTGLPFTVDSSSGCGVYANVTSTANFGGTQASSPTTLYFLTSSSSAALRGYHPYYVA